MKKPLRKPRHWLSSPPQIPDWPWSTETKYDEKIIKHTENPKTLRKKQQNSKAWKTHNINVFQAFIVLKVSKTGW